MGLTLFTDALIMAMTASLIPRRWGSQGQAPREPRCACLT
jgi:hypothetical protein